MKAYIVKFYNQIINETSESAFEELFSHVKGNSIEDFFCREARYGSHKHFYIELMYENKSISTIALSFDTIRGTFTVNEEYFEDYKNVCELPHFDR